jgi:hypothetical protein
MPSAIDIATSTHIAEILWESNKCLPGLQAETIECKLMNACDFHRDIASRSVDVIASELISSDIDA